MDPIVYANKEEKLLITIIEVSFLIKLAYVL